MRRLTAALVGAAAALGCASPGTPPGGPPDSAPPKLVRVVPDTNALNARPPAVLLRFDEVVSERPQGAPTLDRVFIVSPRDGDPRVRWHREEISIRPRDEWRPNTVYTVTMLPGIADLRGNVRRDGAQLVFSTGGTMPATRMSGIVWDWPAGAPAVRAWVEAISRPDSVVYVALTDSGGAFAIAHAPPGEYLVRGFIDANNNRGFDEREAWDSTTIRLADSSRVELLLFAHDTVGPRIETIAVRDSVTLRVTFDRPIDPGQRIDVARFSLRAADSSQVRLARAVGARDFDAAADSARRMAPRDSAAAPAPTRARPTARADSIPAAALLRPSRPPPASEVVVITATPLTPGAAYRLQATDIRGLTGRTRTSDRSVTIAKPSPAVPADSTRPAPVTPAMPVRPPAPAGRPGGET